MANEIFIDASAWVAVAVKTDNHHQAATQIYPQILTNYSRLVSTSLVIAEAYALIRNKIGHAAGQQFLASMSSQRLERTYSDETLEKHALEILRRYDDHAFSYADAVSFALMRERKIRAAFTFDKHFEVMGFKCVP